MVLFIVLTDRCAITLVSFRAALLHLITQQLNQPRNANQA